MLQLYSRLVSLVERQSKVVTMGGIVLLWIITYFFPNRLTFWPRQTMPWLANEADWPLIDWSVLVYLSVAILLLIAAWRLSRAAYARTWIGVAMLMVLHGIVFLLYPTIYPRPTTLPSGWWQSWYALMWQIDAAHNCFPSLHVAIPTLVSLTLWRDRGWRCGLPLSFWTALIAISIVTTKQHYAIDAFGGLVTGEAIFCTLDILHHEAAPE